MSEQKIAKINITLEDTIGFGAQANWSKVKVGVSVTREVTDNGADSIKKELEELSNEVAKPFIAVERAKVLKMIQSQGE